MFIMARVCADFKNKKGEVIHSIRPDDLRIFHEAPDAIQEDILFKMLVDDGSIVLPPKDNKEKAKLENEPDAGTTADGKKISKATEEEIKQEEKEIAEAAGTVENSDVEAEKKIEKATRSKK